MAEDALTAVMCGNGDCGYEFAGGRAALGEPRQPCPRCGSTVRRSLVGLAAEAKGVASLAGVAFTDSKSKWFAKFHDRQELFRLTGRLHRVRRMFNKRADQYEEVIVDEATGDPVRDVYEPLSQHRGHGSAKR